MRIRLRQSWLYFRNSNFTMLYFTGPNWAVLPHRLPAPGARCQQLCAGWADTAGTPPHAPALLGGHRRQPPPPCLPAAGAGQGELQGQRPHTTDWCGWEWWGLYPFPTSLTLIRLGYFGGWKDWGGGGHNGPPLRSRPWIVWSPRKFPQW